MPTILFAGAMATLFFACTQLIAKDKQPLHYLMIAASLSAEYVFLYYWAVETGSILKVPVLINSDIAMVFVLAPSFYLASLTVLHEGRKPVRSLARHFIAPILVALGCGTYTALTMPARARELGVFPGHFTNLPITILTLVADLTFLAVVLLDLVAALRLFKGGRVRDARSFFHQVSFLFCYLGASLILLIGFILRSEYVIDIAVLVFCFEIFCFALSRTYISYFSPDVGSNATARSEWDDSAAELSARLVGLMEKEAPYRHADLTVRRLAHLLGEEPKRLSYHFKRSLSTSYSGYINDWRLRSVCRDLVEKPRRSILDIAMDNGFNSKSSFNTLFRNKYGKTPRAFRREKLGRSGDSV